MCLHNIRAHIRVHQAVANSPVHSIRVLVPAGDATWSVSTGLGACIAGAVYEVGRPKRYTAEEAAQLDAEWRDFGEPDVVIALTCVTK